MTILLKPIVNEKSTILMKGDWFTFRVGLNATKSQIEKEVKDKFKVDVLQVKTINIKGKRKSQRSRKGYFITTPVKKALVQLKKGQKIAIFEMAEAEKTDVEVRTAEGEVIAKTKEKKSLLRGTKVKIEQLEKDQESKEDIQKKTDTKRPTKVSGKGKKG